ncbi:DUF4124 domain-containing protein [Leucothrix arctica]|uniref:DUF4124 domain-containing protein n=1 Tax=Leucothrix arctica TaxID=1481894 RepID=A0A317C4J0_9GAMM|nr:DUF4124 domain-containing protein [Leucothrix arctica]PWQ93524.1 hypothetical protein DKT75_18060 [Leucothrix arctica]
MPTTRLRTALLLIAILLYMPLAHAEIYQWVDANGMTHFSDKPRKSGPSNVIRKAKAVNKEVRRKALPKRQFNRPVKQVRRVAKPVRTRKAPVVKKVINRQMRSNVVANKEKPQKRVAPRPKQVLTKRPYLVENEQRPEISNYAANLTASLSATIYDIERITEPKPELAPEVVFEAEPMPPQRKVISNVKQSLCQNNQRLLTVLHEKGFEYYYDDTGDLRVAWGVEGFYRQKTRYLSDNEVAQKTKAVSFGIKQYCEQPFDKKLQAKAREDWIRSEYCDVSKVILADLKHPFMRTSDRDIQDQEKEMKRFCSEYPTNKYRDDERYYPKSLHVKRLNQKHFLYR